MTVIPISPNPRIQAAMGRLTRRNVTAFRCNHWLALIGICLILRFMSLLLVPLLPEEAYYWMYSQHPSLSYFDHPPAIAWVIRSGTVVFGNNEFGVRIVGDLLMIAASVLMYLQARFWTGKAASLIAAAALQVLPGYFATGFIATMDAPLIFFWMLCLLGVSLVLRRDASWGWYLAAIGLGGAMLSKYTGVFPGAGALLAVLGVRRWRRHLCSIHPYAAAALALAMFTPVLIWNAENQWASFRFQFGGRFVDRGVSAQTMLGFAGGQLLIATPLILAAMTWLLARAVRQRRIFVPRTWFMISFSAPLLTMMAYKSLKYSIHINWTIPAYLCAFPFVAQACIAAWRRQRIGSHARDWTAMARWTVIVCLAVNSGACLYLVTLQPRLRAPAEFGPWRNLAAAVEDLQDRLEAEDHRQPMIIANGEYRLASILAFYCTPLDDQDIRIVGDPPLSTCVTSQWFIRGSGLGYEYWGDPNDWIGRDCIFVNDKRDLVDNLQNRFDSVELVSDPRLPAGGRYQMAICRGYRGPVPATPNPVVESTLTRGPS